MIRPLPPGWTRPEMPYPLGRNCCGAPDATACHQRGLCWMEGVHPESPGYTAAQASESLREAVHRIVELVETGERHGHPKVRGYQTPAMREVLTMLRRALDGTR